MTNNAKEYLMQYRIIQSRLRAIDNMLAEIRRELSGLGAADIGSPWPDGQPRGTGTGDPTGNRAARDADSQSEQHREELRRQLLDLEVRELRTRSDLWMQRCEIEETLGQVGNAAYQDLLRMRYIEGRTFEWIAVEMNYTYRHVVGNLHSAALAAVQRILQYEKSE